MLCALAAGGGKVRRRNSISSLSQLLDSQTSGDRDDDNDSVISSRPPSFDRGQPTGTDSTITTAVINANGSVPRDAGTDNTAFDGGSEMTEEKPSESDQTSVKRGVKTTTADVTREAGVDSVSAGQRHRAPRPLSKKVSFVAVNEEPEGSNDNPTE